MEEKFGQSQFGPKSAFYTLDKKFSSPEEEIAFLREQVAENEQALRERGEIPLQERIISEKISEYAEVPKGAVLAQGHALTEKQAGAIVLDLSPENHDTTMADLLGHLQEKGLRNALDIMFKIAEHDDLARRNLFQ